MFRKILVSLITTFAIIGGAMSVSAATSGDYEYTDNGDGTATITNYTGPGGNIAVPDTLDGIPVAIIGNSAFFDKKLTGLVLPEGLKTIGMSAFWVNDLGAVTIPSTVEFIGNSAFRQANLTSVTLNEGLKTMETYAFSQNFLTTLTVPKSVDTLGNAVFRGNTITEAAFLGSPSTIGTDIFAFNEPIDLIVSASEDSTMNAYSVANGYTFVSTGSPTSASIPTMVEVIPGTLTFANELISVYADQVTLNGQNQTITALFSDTMDVIDARGNHLGYDVQVDFTDLISGANVITRDNITLKNLQTTSIDGVNGPAENVSAASAFSLINLGAGQGIGQHIMNFANVEMDVFISDKTIAGIYDGTMTFSLVTTP